MKEFIGLSYLTLACKNCKSAIHLEGLDLMGHSRQWDFDGLKGEVRCSNCGFLNNIKFKLTGKIESLGFVCGVCKKIDPKMYDNYFCLDCYKKHLKEDIKCYKKQLMESQGKLKKCVSSSNEVNK